MDFAQISIEPHSFYELDENELIIEDKLNEQFRYFYNEFIDSAVTLNITIPLDIVEDKTGNVHSFLKNNGPKYVLQILQNSIHHSHLIRCAVSLLILTITILRRKVPKNYKASINDINEGPPSQIQHFITEESWAADALNRIAEMGAIPVCIDILIASHVANIQELTLNLISLILLISDDSITFMFQPPHNQVFNDVKRENSIKLNVSGATDLRNPSTKTKIDHNKFNFKYNTREYFKEKPIPPKAPEPIRSCLSYILTIVMLDKNRHILMAGCADIIIAMTKSDIPDIAKSIAETSTCPIPLIDPDSDLPSKLHAISRQNPNKMQMNPLSINTLEWAGLKLLLKFLYRFHIITKPKPNSLPRDSLSAPMFLRDEYLYAYDRVLTALSSLIINSPEVAMYTNTLPGAVHLIKTSFAEYPTSIPSSTEKKTLSCLNILQNEDSPTGLFIQTDSLVDHQSSSHRSDTIDTHPSSRPATAPLHPSDSLSITQLQPSNASLSSFTSSAAQKQLDGLQKQKKKIHQQLLEEQARNRPPVESMETHPPTGSPPQMHELSVPINLMNNINRKFGVTFAVETEQDQLYLLHNYEKAQKSLKKSDGGAADGGEDPHRRDHRRLAGYDPTRDKEFSNYLDRINQATNQKIIRNLDNDDDNDDVRKLTKDWNKDGTGMMDGSSSDGMGKNNLPSLSNHNLMNDVFNQSNDNTSAASSVSGGFYFNPKSVERAKQKQAIGDEEKLQRLKGRVETTKRAGGPQTLSPPMSQFPNIHEAFFNQFPTKPVVPRRIEPIDIIKKDEDLTRMRQRYEELARNAINELKYKGYMKNGKFSVPIEDRARRVYGVSPFVLPPSSSSKKRSPSISQTICTPPSFKEQSVSQIVMNPSNDVPIDDRTRDASSSEIEFGDPVTGEESAIDSVYIHDNIHIIPPPSISPLKSHGTSGMNQDLNFGEDELFQNFKPIFEVSGRNVPAMKSNEDNPNEGSRSKYGQKVKAQLELSQSLDMLFP